MARPMTPRATPPRWRRRVVAGEFLCVLILWQISVANLGLVNPAFFPPPLTILKTGVGLLSGSAFWEHLQYSVVNWLSGYTLATVVGVTTGLVAGTLTPAYQLIVPLAWSLYATPLVSIRPMTVVWFGFGAAPIVFLIFISAIFPIMLNTAAGIRTVDPTLVRAARVFGANRIRVYLKVVLPSTLPHISAGMRLAIPSSLIGMLVGELVGSPKGLGALISLASSTFRTDRVMAVIVVLVVLSLSLIRSAEWLQRRLAPWYQHEARGT